MTATPLIIPVARFFDASGVPLAFGWVYTYETGTLTPKATYTDYTGGTPNTNPIHLDASGQANIWLDGIYTINVEDSDHVQQAHYPQDGVSSFSSGDGVPYVVATGTGNAYILTPSPSITSYTAGDAFLVKINETNTGPATVNISNLGAQAVVIAPDSPLGAGVLVQDSIYLMVYDGTNFQILNASSASITDYAATTGVANTYILSPTTAITTYDAGLAFNIKMNVDNTGASTINISGVGAKDLVVYDDYPLTGGELIADTIYRIVYNGTNFQVLNPTPPITITMGASATAPWGTLPMTGSTVAKTSGGTYNSTVYSRLYSYLWNNYSNSVAPVATGRGANAAADFAANKTITIPDYRDYTPLGVSGAGVITASGATAGASTVTPTGAMGTTGGHALTINEMPAHDHPGTYYNTGAGNSGMAVGS